MPRSVQDATVIDNCSEIIDIQALNFVSIFNKSNQLLILHFHEVTLVHNI